LLEHAVRKILVVSQKSGVGKTTASINLAAAAAAAGARVLLLDADPLSNVSTALNLAAHPNHQSLRENGSRLPGLFIPELAPGLDVLSPYEDGGCSDDEFEELLRTFATAEFRDGYDCVIADAPPFLGARPGQLVNNFDEYLMVMRAEANAHRTLPAFHELVQRSKKGGKPPQLRGVLLTLGEGDKLGGRWERELRGRLGSRALPQAIPHDTEAARIRDAGQVLVQAAPHSAIASLFVGLAVHLNLSGHGRKHVAHGADSPLRLAIAACATVPAAVGITVPEFTTPAADWTSPSENTSVKLPSPTFAPILPAPEEPDLPTDVGRFSMPEMVLPPLAPSLRSASKQVPLNRPPRRTPTPPKPPLVPPRPPAPAPRPSSGSKTRLTVVRRRVQQPLQANNRQLILWVGAGMILGIALRFVQIPVQFVPLTIGFAVTVGVLLLLRLVMVPADSADASPARPSGSRRTRVIAPLVSSAKPAEPKRDSKGRISTIARRPGRTS
jgi:chromosome partitioning protein